MGECQMREEAPGEPDGAPMEENVPEPTDSAGAAEKAPTMSVAVSFRVNTAVSTCNQ